MTHYGDDRNWSVIQRLKEAALLMQRANTLCSNSHIFTSETHLTGMTNYHLV